jgi:hypothetical protein
MFTKGYSRLVVLCSCVMLMAGCATSRSEIKLQSPAVVAPAATEASAQHVVVIGKITDERAFEDSPNDPSIPSLGFGGAGKASDDVKERAVARKRNGYGMALGDVLLQSGQTVEGVIRENLTAAFQQAGYQVKSASDAGPSPLVVDVHIKTFWAWFTPGFWAITLSDNIATDLVFNSNGAPVVVSTHVEEKRQGATDNAWIEIVDKGLDAYRAEVLHRLQGSDVASMAGAANALPASQQPDAQVATVTALAAPSTQAPSASPAVATEAAAPQPVPALETKPETATPSQPTAPIATASASDSTTSASTSQADEAMASMAQNVASGLGCNSVQANGNSTYVAACGSYGVLIDCDGGLCRPMHTVNVKKDE